MRPLYLALSQFKMALSMGWLVTSIMSPCAGKGDPDCSKTKLTIRLHPPEYFTPFLPTSVRMCLFWVDLSSSSTSASYLATLLWRKGEEDYFSPRLRVCIKDHKNSPHGKFHRFLFPFSSKFSDLKFASYVLYNLPVLCHVSRTVSMGYLFWLLKRQVPLYFEQIITGHLTGCSGADPHNLSTSASSASLGNFSA